VEPKTIDSGLELSPEVEEKIPRIMELIIEEIEKTNISTEGAR
jgi:Ni,Fe-hydrogenase maturation factor